MSVRTAEGRTKCGNPVATATFLLSVTPSIESDFRNLGVATFDSIWGYVGALMVFQLESHRGPLFVVFNAANSGRKF